MKFHKKSGGSEVSGDFSILKKIVSGLSTKNYIEVGILDGSATGKNGAKIHEYMAVHEFGSISQNIPARSWLQMPLTARKKIIKKMVDKKFKTLMSQGDVRGVYELLGKACEAQIQAAFDSGGFGTWAPSDSPSPLVDTGAARNAVSSKVGGPK